MSAHSLVLTLMAVAALISTSQAAAERSQSHSQQPSSPPPLLSQFGSPSPYSRAASAAHGRHAPPSRSSWADLQRELVAEVEAGLDEDDLRDLEQRSHSSRATSCTLAQPPACDTSGGTRVAIDVLLAPLGNMGGTSTPRLGRLVVEVWNGTTPHTARNFLSICEGARVGTGSGVGAGIGARRGRGRGQRAQTQKLHYAGSRFHRIIPGFMAQGGDIDHLNGRGGRSIYGSRFPDESFACRHACRGVLSMANSGPDSNGSQFFLTFAPTPWLDSRHVVFGQVVDGWNTLDEMEKAGSEGGQPTASVILQRCTVGV